MGIKEKILFTCSRFMGFMAQEEKGHNPVKTITPGMPGLLREVASQGAVPAVKSTIQLS